MVPYRAGPAQRSHVFWRSVAWIDRVAGCDGPPADPSPASSYRDDVLDLLNGWRQVAGLPPLDVPQQPFDFESLVLEVQSLRDGRYLSRSVEGLDIDLSLFDAQLVAENYSPETVIGEPHAPPSDRVALPSSPSFISNERVCSPSRQTPPAKRRRLLSPRLSETASSSNVVQRGDLSLTSPGTQNCPSPSNTATSSRLGPSQTRSDPHPAYSSESEITNTLLGAAFGIRGRSGDQDNAAREQLQCPRPDQHTDPISHLVLFEHAPDGDHHRPAVFHQTPQLWLPNSLGLYDERHPHSSSSQGGHNEGSDITHGEHNVHHRDQLHLQPTSEGGSTHYGLQQTQHSSAQQRDHQPLPADVEDQVMGSEEEVAAELASQDQQQGQHDVMEREGGAQEPEDNDDSERENEAMGIDSGEHCGLTSK